MKRLKFQILGSLALSISSFNSDAGIIAERSRVIYAGNQRELSLRLNNSFAHAVQTQVWVDQGFGDPDKAQAPFRVLSPTFMFPAQEYKDIRIMITPQHHLPQQRESLFWLNLYEFPHRPITSMQHNRADLGINTQLKLIYRPQPIAHVDLYKIYTQLKISLSLSSQGITVQIDNPSAYYLSMTQLVLQNNSLLIEANEKKLMLSPQSSNYFTFNTSPSLTPVQLKLILLDDYGKSHTFEKKL